MLTWPMEWSALHGIAEIRTPLLKIATDAEATPEKHVVRTTGSAYPDEGARGIVYPYTRARQLVPPSWLHTDNGFRSGAAMRQAHDEIVRLAVRSLRECRGPVLDLGCGNGVLLDRIARRAGVPGAGIELDDTRIEHGRALYPEIAFQQGDLFEPFDGEYALVLISAARLIERPGLSLRVRARRVMLYHYSDLNLAPEDLASLMSSIGAERLAHLVAPSAVIGCYSD
jgi:SAM-dependent methyltransferase